MPENRRGKSNVTNALLIAALGIVIGFLGELMPDSLKTSLETFAGTSLGISYTVFWWLAVGVVVGLILWQVWKSPAEKPPETAAADNTEKQLNKPGRKIKMGKKSVYVEKNKGDINL